VTFCIATINPSNMEDVGVYAVRFFKDGYWRYSIVDDYLAFAADGSHFYAHGNDRNEVWVALMEKAYAKYHDTYEAIDGGLMREALVDLIGGVGKYLILLANTAVA
jgi:Calpain family cysteine protease